MPPTIKLADYLFARLKQLGVDSIHGVPGDFNLALLDYVEPSGLHWVGNANELNAGYAADGYARVKGVGAIITTFGVGELSAINAIAGAYAERAAVVHIVGTPDRAKQDSRLLIHHTFNDGEYRRFGQMHAHITVAQTRLRDPRTSPGQIDEVLRQCLLHSRPVYIELPVDLVGAPVSAEGLNSELRIPDGQPTPTSDAALAGVLERIYHAKQPTILVDGETRPLGIAEDVQSLVKSTGWPTWANPLGHGLVDGTIPNVHGIYKGSFDDPAVQKFFNESDLILCFGPHFSSTNTSGYTAVPSAKAAVLFTDAEVKVGEQVFRDVPAKFIVSQLIQALDLSKTRRYEPYPDLPRYQLKKSFSDVPRDQPVDHDNMWGVLANFLRPGDIVMGETGTAGYGVRNMPLPPHTTFFTPATWLSIGYMLGAAQGAALAQRELIEASRYHDIKDARTILFIGDGSFQMTAQELGTIIRLDLDVVLFLVNNDGYTIERCIHGLKQKYNDITPWRYLQAPSFFGAREDTYTAQVRTYGDLERVLSDESLNKGKGLKMIELCMGQEDTPEGLLSHMMKTQKAKYNIG